MALPKIYVGNLPPEATDEEVAAHFSEVGEVLKVYLVTDRNTGRPMGYGFVEYASARAVPVALRQLHGRALRGRPLNVRVARERH